MFRKVNLISYVTQFFTIQLQLTAICFGLISIQYQIDVQSTSTTNRWWSIKVLKNDRIKTVLDIGKTSLLTKNEWQKGNFMFQTYMFAFFPLTRLVLYESRNALNLQNHSKSHDWNLDITSILEAVWRLFLWTSKLSKLDENGASNLDWKKFLEHLDDL